MDEDQPQAAETPHIFIAPSNLPPPKSITFDDNLATTWKSWKKAWSRYEIATSVHKEEGIVRVSTLLSVIGEDGVKAHDTFTWNLGEDQNDIDIVLRKFDQYCTPRTQINYERYRFNNRNQEPGENISNYLTELRTIAKNCAHDTITPDEILRDRLVLGIRDDHVRERLLRTNELTLPKAVNIIKAAEQTQQQVKFMAGGEDSVNLLHKQRSERTQQPLESKQQQMSNQRPQNQRNQRRRREQGEFATECGNCGTTHDERNCPAFGKSVLTVTK